MFVQITSVRSHLKGERTQNQKKLLGAIHYGLGLLRLLKMVEIYEFIFADSYRFVTNNRFFMFPIETKLFGPQDLRMG